jgi:hypothetical protein
MAVAAAASILNSIFLARWTIADSALARQPGLSARAIGQLVRAFGLVSVLLGWPLVAVNISNDPDHC